MKTRPALASLWPFYRRAQRRSVTETLERRIAEQTEELARLRETLALGTVERERSEEAAVRARRIADALADSAKQLLGVVDQQAVLRQLTVHVRQLTGSDFSYIAVRQRDAEEFTIVAATKHPARTDDYPEDTRHDPAFCEMALAEGIVSLAVLPITLDDRVTGLLYAAHGGGREYSPEDLETMSRLADQAALALRTTSLLAELDTARDGKRFEEHTRQSQKLHVVGGIAHDLNDLLTVISGQAEFLRSAIGEDRLLTMRVTAILSAVDRSSALIRQMPTFSRIHAAQATVVDLNVVIHGLDDTLRRILGEDVTLQVSLAPKLGVVRADRVHLEEVILNLIINARDTMRAGGTLSLETFCDASTVTLVVRDTGVGTGAEAGSGTTFQVRLPRYAGAAGRNPEPVCPALPLGHDKIVLVVDDDGAIRRLAVDKVRALGYRVLEAARPSQAQAIAARHPEPIDVLLTDVVMPEMYGPELAATLGKDRPEMKIVFMSGDAEHPGASEHAVRGNGLLLEKPFTVERLAETLRRAVDGHAR